MKFRKLGQVLLASVVSLGLVAGFTACTTRTIDFVYVTSSKNDPGQLSVFKVDNDSGRLKKLPVSPYTLRYRNPITILADKTGKNLYILYRDDNVIQQFGVGTDGKVYPYNTYNTPGGYPIAMAIDSQSKNLYVLDTYQPGFTDAAPGPGSVTAYPINADGSLGTAITNGKTQFYAVGTSPAAITVSKDGTKVYVSDKADGTIHVFLRNATDGSLSAASPATYVVGSQPYALATDSTGKFLYVSDYSNNKIFAYQYGDKGLTALSGSPYATGNQPIALTISPAATGTQPYLFAVNYTDGSISGYLLNSSTGALTAMSAGTVASTDPQPTCALIEPLKGRYLYTTNFLGNSVSSYQINSAKNTVESVQNSKVTVASQPTCAVAVSLLNGGLASN